MSPRNFRYYVEHAENPFRLGRHQMHDLLTADRAFLAPRRPLVSRAWTRAIAPFDQGDLGSCTANAALGCLMTAPFRHPQWNFTEADAVKLYSQETLLDDSQIPGHYPPDDTGSTGPFSMMALRRNGTIHSWTHTRSAMGVLQMLQSGPASIGIPWFQSMFTPDPQGLLTVDLTSGIAGGHQIEVCAVDVHAQTVTICNSWGSSWGRGGYADLAWHDLDYLFAHGGGDAVQPVL